MQSTTHFKQTIQNYLDKRATDDPLFAAVYTDAPKPLDSCINHILNAVLKSKCNGFTDDEIYTLAVNFYYDDDGMDTAEPTNDFRVVVNHIVELTPEEKDEARNAAMQQAINEAYTKIRTPRKKSPARQNETYNQPTLFNFEP